MDTSMVIKRLPLRNRHYNYVFLSLKNSIVYVHRTSSYKNHYLWDGCGPACQCRLGSEVVSKERKQFKKDASRGFRNSLVDFVETS